MRVTQDYELTNNDINKMALVGDLREKYAGGSRVYGAKKMPTIILSEFRALRAARREQSNGDALT